MWKRLARWSLMGALAVLAVLQFVPYGRAHSNPPVNQEPAWDNPQTRSLAARACFDCHSNETKWPWYSHMAPVSWLVQRDVDLGRSALNFSEWNRPQSAAGESAEAIQEGEMPMRAYRVTHPEARLSPAERQALIQGLAATIGSGTDASDGEEREHHDEREERE